MTASRDDIAWASQAMKSGQSLEYIASVLETSQKNARRLIRNFENPKKTRSERDALERANTKRVKPGEKIVLNPEDVVVEVRNRRQAVLRRRFAKHWNMIWFLRERHMSGRTLRNIYGPECLIWSVGGGIDARIE